jgi:hypothetical protein
MVESPASRALRTWGSPALSARPRYAPRYVPLLRRQVAAVPAGRGASGRAPLPRRRGCSAAAEPGRVVPQLLRGDAVRQGVVAPAHRCQRCLPCVPRVERASRLRMHTYMYTYIPSHIYASRLRLACRPPSPRGMVWRCAGAAGGVRGAARRPAVRAARLVARGAQPGGARARGQAQSPSAAEVRGRAHLNGAIATPQLGQCAPRGRPAVAGELRADAELRV